MTTLLLLAALCAPPEAAEKTPPPDVVAIFDAYAGLIAHHEKRAEGFKAQKGRERNRAERARLTRLIKGTQRQADDMRKAQRIEFPKVAYGVSPVVGSFGPGFSGKVDDVLGKDEAIVRVVGSSMRLVPNGAKLSQTFDRKYTYYRLTGVDTSRWVTGQNLDFQKDEWLGVVVGTAEYGGAQLPDLRLVKRADVDRWWAKRK